MRGLGGDTTRPCALCPETPVWPPRRCVSACREGSTPKENREWVRPMLVEEVDVRTHGACLAVLSFLVVCACTAGTAGAMQAGADVPGLDFDGWESLFQEDYDDATLEPDLLPSWDYSADEFAVGSYDGASVAIVNSRGFFDFVRPWTDYAAVTRVAVLAGTLTLSYRKSETSRYYVEFDPDAGMIHLGKAHLLEGRPRGWGQRTRVASAPFLLVYGAWYEVAILGEGASLQVFVDDQLTLSFVDPDPLLAGGVGFETVGESPRIIVDSIRVWSSSP